jgi:hypothetical protein
VFVFPGWESPKLVDWLAESVDKASKAYFGKEVCCTHPEPRQLKCSFGGLSRCHATATLS